jgi:hypothetical protein
MGMIARRGVLAGLAAAAIARPLRADDGAPAPPLGALISHPLLLRSLYRLRVGDSVAADGAAGVNRGGYRFIEEQRQGAEWIVRGVAHAEPAWVILGWRVLDWGLARQQDDGGFGGGDAFHSASFFLEALARACVVDPAGATPARLAGLRRAARWQSAAAARGAPGNRPFTHRRYILAAGFGLAAAAAGEAEFARIAADWAREGIALQGADGVNPERGGGDAGYQMVGVCMAQRYLTACGDSALRANLRRMTRAAIGWELARQTADGAVDAAGSTRITIERGRDGTLKAVPYAEIMQALVYAAQTAPEPAWLGPAERIATLRHWMRA